MNDINKFFSFNFPFILLRFCYKGYFVNSNYVQLQCYYKFCNYFEVLLYI